MRVPDPDPFGVGMYGHETAYQGAYLDGHAKLTQDRNRALATLAVPHDGGSYWAQESVWINWFEAD
jgi:hypothetical protein